VEIKNPAEAGLKTTPLLSSNLSAFRYDLDDFGDELVHQLLDCSDRVSSSTAYG
jgi:hypothetical protein